MTLWWYVNAVVHAHAWKQKADQEAVLTVESQGPTLVGYGSEAAVVPPAPLSRLPVPDQQWSMGERLR